MPKKLIKDLVLASYTNGDLDSEKVEKIAKMLSRSMLKQYLKALKHRDSYLSVAINSAFAIGDMQKEELESMFPEKKITYNIDPRLVAGIKVTKDDIIFEMSIKGVLDEMLKKLRKDYD